MTHDFKPNLRRLRERAELLGELRRFFDSRGFLEVQPPCLSRDCVVDSYIDPIEVPAQQFRLACDLPPVFYLQTSPEAAMKRMLAAGAPSIYSLGPVFRAGERGELHNVEFTMLEWYDVGADADASIRLLGELACSMLGHESTDHRAFDVYTYRQLFRDVLDFDPLDAELKTLQDQVRQFDAPLSVSIGADRDGLLDVILTHFLQPSLGVQRPAIVRNYPLSQAALARKSTDDDQCAARFELFVEGIEIANGYDELCDPDELSKRFERCNAKRVRDGRNPLNAETSLIAAMREGLPKCAGVALGVDRLLMVRTGEKLISNVLPFRIDSA